MTEDIANEDEFDSLSFFSAGPVRCVSDDQSTHLFEPSNHEEPLVDTEEEEGVYPIHILDLPSHSQNPPFIVLDTILKLLKKPDIHNFHASQAPSSESNKSSVETLEERGITLEDASQTLEWLTANSPVMGRNMNQLVFSTTALQASASNEPDLIAYYTKLISAPLHTLSKITQQEHETLLSMASNLIAESSGRASFPTFTRKIHLPGFKQVVKLIEPAMSYENLGLKTWGSSLHLSSRLVNSDNWQRLVKGDVLELGAGTGLCGITVGLLARQYADGGVGEIMLTDLEPIVKNLKNNVEVNGLSNDTRIRCEVLDWSNPESFIKIVDVGKKYDTIILSDPIYSELHPGWVRDMIKLFLRHQSEDDGLPGGKVLLEIPRRERFEKEREDLWHLIDEAGLIEVESEEEEGFDDFGEQTFLFKCFKWK
ncbi:hypothetical protein CANARDRAFT_8722 [[Candida] arabinofermentans NRRL YB-2248]|uniref:FAM86 N-terminal domain-containing protein n=1 Tax=[Candida] arabinofermentans NRRL YB-2248 TaxID=983967 RepID=A0A1E4SXZ5_9ASCO|nr:hypothetical protein CANARDRAFT_8722 [[Candida] arabinofermentans NRRL YB-2248]